MIKVFHPENFLLERKYIVDILLLEFLGLKIEHATSPEINETKILFENGHSLIVKDHFFSIIKDSSTYLSLKNLPKSILWIYKKKNDFITEKKLPILYGNDTIVLTKKNIILGADVFASAFFMLTRWEEYINKNKDIHQRFLAEKSVAFQNSFLKEPIVDQYVEMLWNMFLYLGVKQKRKIRQFNALLTYDVDMALLWPNYQFIFKKSVGDLLKRRNITEALFTLRNGLKTKYYKYKDPFDTFDFLIKQTEEIGLQAHFFFLSGGDSKYDQSLRLDHQFMKDLFDKLKQRNHIIGFHPSYDTYKDIDLFKKEKLTLEKAIGCQVKVGRQHFLRFHVPETWQIWDTMGMDWDSTMYYAEHPGFRCGTCHAYSVFNILTRKKLKIKELPLTAMEISWINYLKTPPDQMFNDISSLIKKVRKYKGTFVLLWHNSSFNIPEFQPYEHVYKKILGIL